MRQTPTSEKNGVKEVGGKRGMGKEKKEKKGTELLKCPETGGRE